ncbi:MAG: hypothetical protein L3J91_00125 [Thermoplasmata archaeon]|nr:hypothetical protein [Thermoplasmata archaeon]
MNSDAALSPHSGGAGRRPAVAPGTWALLLGAIAADLCAWPLQLAPTSSAWVFIALSALLLAGACLWDVRSRRASTVATVPSAIAGRAAPAFLVATPHELHADILSQIESAIIGFFTSIFQGIENFFGTIFQAIANTFALIFSAPGAAIQASFASLTIWASQYGPLAPLITIGVVSIVLIIATFLIWLIIKISTSEAEQTGEEVEEGV